MVTVVISRRGKPSMDQDMPDIDPALARITPEDCRDYSPPHVNVGTATPPNDDTPEELRERAEFAAELEAMLDAEAATEAAQEEESAFEQAQAAKAEMDVDMANGKKTDMNLNPTGDAGFNEADSECEPLSALTYRPTATSNIHTLRSAFKEVEEPRYINPEREKRIAVSQVKKMVAQQILNKARNHIKEVSKAQGT